MKRWPYLALLIFHFLLEVGFTYAAEKGLAARWTFDEARDSYALDAVKKMKDELDGYSKYLPGISGQALQLDGYTTRIIRKAGKAPRLSKALTVQAWIAVQAYPWNWNAIVSQAQGQEAGYFFGIDQDGRVALKMAVDGVWHECVSREQVPLLEWTHVAGTFDGSGLKVFINGREVASLEAAGKLTAAKGVDLLVGRNHEPSPLANLIRLDYPVEFSFDGLFDEVRIYKRALSASELEAAYRANVPAEAQALTYRQLPSGPEGPGRFGAYTTRLYYDDTWEWRWRVGPDPDVLVRFDEAPYKFVFWRGTSYIPCWVTENSIWYTNEFNETWGHGAEGSAEPMSDKQTKHSHVRIIESNDARVVVHWRYGLVDNRYTFARVDDLSGWGDWSDEYYTIYPDGVGIRKIHLWSSQPMDPHEFQESIVINPPGTRPEDNIETDALTMVNLKGEFHTYSWGEQTPGRVSKPENPVIEYINLKAQYNPFLIVSEKPYEYYEEAHDEYIREHMTGAERQAMLEEWHSLPNDEARDAYDDSLKQVALSVSCTDGVKVSDGPSFFIYDHEVKRENSIFPWWNHWPVAQIPSDGRWATQPDRASHSSLTTGLEWEDYEVTANSRVRIMMHGLTDKPARDLAPLAKSWLHPPELQLGDGSTYTHEGYEPAERAYQLSADESGAQSPLSFQIAASRDSPIINPAFVVKGWGRADMSLTINGRAVDRGKAFRYGHRQTEDGFDLVVWIKLESTKPVDMTFTPADR